MKIATTVKQLFVLLVCKFDETTIFMIALNILQSLAMLVYMH